MPSVTERKFEADVNMTMNYHIPHGLTPEKFPAIYGTAYARRIFAEARKRLAKEAHV